MQSGSDAHEKSDIDSRIVHQPPTKVSRPHKRPFFTISEFVRRRKRPHSPSPNGGASRDRTDDPLLAKQVLSQLSYGPNSNPPRPRRTIRSRKVVGRGRLELPTSRLSGVRSNHLSYRPPPFATSPRPSDRDLATGGDAHAPERLRGRRSPRRIGEKEKRGRRRPAKCFLKKLMFQEFSIDRSAKGRRPEENILRKEVIQPQVPLRLPCYDFTPVADPTVAACLRS